MKDWCSSKEVDASCGAQGKVWRWRQSGVKVEARCGGGCKLWRRSECVWVKVKYKSEGKVCR